MSKRVAASIAQGCRYARRSMNEAIDGLPLTPFSIVLAYALAAAISVPITLRITMYNCSHLGMGPGERRAQVEQVLQGFDTPAMPVILLGDLDERLIYVRTLRRLVSHFYRARPHLGACGRASCTRRRASRSACMGSIGSLSVDRRAIHVAITMTLVTKPP